MTVASLLAVFETVGSVVGILITFVTFFTLISKRPMKALRRMMREEADAANMDLEREIQEINKKLEAIENKSKDTDEVDQAILRNTITHIYFKYKEDKKIPHYEKENVMYLYGQYKRLKGNSYVRSIMKEIESWEEDAYN